ncbi:uncharacterized protein [Physcomitrium patens]|uniref:uncharacterized protein n=1 Tax=Physcomitrium patens TaxID=3218 RepID=UPI003CCD6BD5
MQALLLLLVLQWLLILRSLAHPSSIWFLFIVAAVSPQYKEQNRALSVWLSGLLLILLHLLNFADRSLLLLGHIPPLGLLLGLLGHGRIAMVSFAVCVSMCAMGDGPDGPLVRSSAHGCDCLFGGSKQNDRSVFSATPQKLNEKNGKERAKLWMECL